MNNLNANASAFLWQVPPPQQLPPQSVQQQTVQSVQSMQSVQHSQLLQSAVVSQPRKFGGNKSNYNYMQNHAIMGPGGGPMGGLGGNPNIYRKRHSINTYNTGLYQTNGKSLFSIPENVVMLESQPPLLGPGAAFPPFGAPEYHTTTPENWKGAAIHPTGLMKEPAGVVPGRNAPVAFTPQGQAQGAVMMVYGLDHDTSNTDKLFNLVCLYGNVARIKFLKTKEGTAMVQMGDAVAVERCVQHLNNIPVGTGGKIQIAFSKQNFLSEVINPFLLPDHSPSFKEYTGSKNNRFLSPAQASKNRIQPPSKILHFFNTPPGLTEDQLIGIFNIKDVPATSVRLFPLKTERSSSGLIEFSNISQAVLAIMKCNHLPIEGKGTKFPFIMKLCFSSSKSMNGAWNNAASEGMIEKENEVDSKVDIYN
ncbi:heterogeneous nuclear ribonucleoprotein L isoform X17 [Drosophila sechellia]|uniref:Heterogeneous nuclear ribonucleoprotein L isoform X24 n=1 Tax=Drosophila mauritiana TaxID=7226 RepID=A0A6P8JJ45_DROMA|nr:heterogeneous nuclear ribonucleoprotein L isoform X17 [Drosophila sechellia]XP_033155825.1 heterogeneous nuclear ribonucleoprotein L isoform X24 [Drosophila mauritiana]